MTQIINLYGGPGTGKSTTAAHTFALLKHAGVNCELVTEYAKDKVWEESLGILGNQIYVFGKQYQRIFRLLNKVDYVITDSPLLLSIHYAKAHGPLFKGLVFEVYDSMSNIDIFLERQKKYQAVGRLQTEEEAKAIDREIRGILDSYIPKSYHVFPANISTPETIAAMITKKGYI